MSEALFRSVAARVGAPVLSSGDFARLGALREVLPRSFTAYYVECRLERGATRVDLLAGTTAKRELRKELAASTRATHASARWQALRRLVDGWCDVSELATIPCLWIELDDVAAPSSEEALSLAVCLDRGYPQTTDHGPGNLALAERAIDQLADAEVARQRAALSRYFAALPERGRVIHLSPMIGRFGAPLKIYGRVPLEALGAFLQRAGWGGSASQVEFLQRAVWAPASTSPDVFFDVAVGCDGPPTIAVVFSPLELRACGDAADRQRNELLRRLTELGLCDPDKAGALAHWVGDERLPDPSVPWPCRVERWLDLKVVCEPNRTSAKAYLGFRAYRTLF